jgi:hypothetical protein
MSIYIFESYYGKATIYVWVIDCTIDLGRQLRIPLIYRASPRSLVSPFCCVDDYYVTNHHRTDFGKRCSPSPHNPFVTNTAAEELHTPIAVPCLTATFSPFHNQPCQRKSFQIEQRRLQTIPTRHSQFLCGSSNFDLTRG